jgi:glycosyltransferase involved in cell wall biosynthesis
MARVLFFTPVLPGLSGQGTAIRAGMALELLAEKHQVTVVHLDLWTGEPAIADRAWPRRLATAYHFVPSPVPPDAAEQLVAKHLSPAGFDAVYVYRLIAAPLALRVMALLGKTPLPNVLDLDDDECARTEKFLALREAVGDRERANRERAELQRQRGFARMMLMRFELCLMASREDLHAVAAQHPGRRFRLLPNVMRVPAVQPALAAAREGSLLFVGTLDYIPNEDAVHYFASAILPILLALTNETAARIDFRIVGIKPPKSFEKLAGRAGLRVVGPVRDLADEYGRARMLVVPLRAGSGTRIKILEAFRFGVPVVSTSIGAEGLGAQDGVHLLIADTPEEFAAACLRLIEDDALAAALAANAFAWLGSTHSMEQARVVVHGLFPEPASDVSAPTERFAQLL